MEETRTNRSKKKKKFSKISKKRMWRYIRNGALALVLIAMIGAVALAFNLVYTIVQDTEAFDPQRVLRFEPFAILDANDKEVYSYGVEPVEYEEIPQVMVDAMIAAEDARYYEHNGFDIPRIISAFFENLSSGTISSGASTITQQTIKKNYYPEEERTYTRKIGEIFLAIQADSEMDKNTILTCYMNTVYYGMGIETQGLKAAAKYYFNKNVNQLTLPEAAYLAGAINAPSAYDAFYDLEEAQSRRDVILDLMEMHGYITSDECALAKKTKVENLLVETNKNKSTYIPNQAYVDAVVEEALDVLYSDQYSAEEIAENKSDLTKELTSKNLTIHTFLNQDIQKYLETEIGTGEASNVYYADDEIEVAGSVQANEGGRIIGLLGGRDYSDSTLNPDLDGPKIFGYNRATTGKQSPGSSLKPIIAYGIGIELLDWPTFASVYDDKFTAGGINLHNWDGGAHGAMPFVTALGNSWNIPAAKNLKQVCDELGDQKAIDYFNAMGLTVNDGYDADGNLVPYGDFNYLYAIGAWAQGITMVQEANAYATVANGGTYYKPHTIDYIEYNSDGTKIMVDEEIAEEATHPLSEESAFMIRELMFEYTMHTNVGSYSYVDSAANDYGLTVGAKSGTSTNDNEETKGQLMSCITPSYTMSFWVGRDSSSETISSVHGGTPNAIVGHVIRALYDQEGVNTKWPTQPAGVKKATVLLGNNPDGPYYLAGEGTMTGATVTGWYKINSDKKPVKAPSAENVTIQPLTSFSVTSINNQALQISFGPYDSRYTTDDGNGDNNMTNPEYLFGRIMYVTIIRDSFGNELLTNMSENPEVTIEYNVTENLQVCGRYQYANVSTLHSQENCQTITTSSSTGSYSSSMVNFNAVVDGNSIRVTVNAISDSSQILVSIQGPNYTSSDTFTGTGQTVFTNLPAGTYTVEVVENGQFSSTNVTIG